MQKRISPYGHLFQQKSWRWVIAIVSLFANTQQNGIAASGSTSTNGIHAVLAEVHTEVTNAILAGNSELMRLLSAPIPSSFQSPLASESKDVSEGISLPSFFLNPRTPGGDISDIFEGKRFGATTEETKTSGRWIMVIPSLVKKDSIELVDWLELRSDRLPPHLRRFNCLGRLGQ